MGDSYFRAGVGIAVVNDDGRVLTLERHDVPGTWQLPQGGVEEGEQTDAAAWRELEEETGLTGAHVRLLGRSPAWFGYELPPERQDARLRRGQVHQWYVMALTDASAKIDLSRIDADKGQPEFSALRWITFDELINTAAGFRVPVYREVAELAASLMAPTTRVSSWRRWTRRPSRTAVERLNSAVASYRRELEFKVGTSTGDSGWIGPVRDALQDARSAQREGRVEEAWASLKAAARLDVFGAERSELLTRAETLRNEAADKLDGWRGRSVAALVDLERPVDRLASDHHTAAARADPAIGDDELLAETRWRVYQATMLRDGAGDNTYYKVALVREQRTLLLLVLATVILVLLALAVTGWLSFAEDPATPSAGLLAGVALFGMLGACLSAIRSMGNIPVGRIPEHTLASKLTVTRPFIGAAAALGVFAILNAGFLKVDTGKHATVALAIAFAAGFSDRLVMGIVGSVKVS